VLIKEAIIQFPIRKEHAAPLPRERITPVYQANLIRIGERRAIFSKAARYGGSQ
jgi:hypothetical protein